MNVVHGIAWYAPESWGGTEQYVDGLAKSLASLGVTSTVLAAEASPRWREYDHRGTRVVRHPRWSGGQSRERLAEWFRTQQIDVYHLHSWSPDAGMAEIEAARDAGLATVLTVHIPAPVCARGTMMRWGSIACDGEIVERRCAGCWMQSRGVPMPVASAIAWLPEKTTALLAATLPKARFGHALRSRSDMRGRRASIERAGRTADRVVAVCDWLRDALLRNGVPADRLVVSRQAIEPGWADALRSATRSPRGGTRILCSGRWDPLKGQHVLVEAMRHVADESVRVRFVAPDAASPDAAAYRDRVIALTGGDSRIEYSSPESREALAAEYANADLLAVPSQWFETGPLVVLEAKAAGLPVLGSNLGGIAELVRPGVDGWLVPHAEARAWAGHIEDFARGTLQLSSSVEPLRTMNDVAKEMVGIYATRRRSGVAA